MELSMGPMTVHPIIIHALLEQLMRYEYSWIWYSFCNYSSLARQGVEPGYIH